MKFFSFLEAAKDDLQSWEAPEQRREEERVAAADEQLLSSELYNQRHMAGAI